MLQRIKQLQQAYEMEMGTISLMKNYMFYP